MNYTIPYKTSPNSVSVLQRSNGTLYVRALCMDGHGDCVFRVDAGRCVVVQENPQRYYYAGSLFNAADGTLMHAALDQAQTLHIDVVPDADPAAPAADTRVARLVQAQTTIQSVIADLTPKA